MLALVIPAAAVVWTVYILGSAAYTLHERRGTGGAL